MAFIAHALQYFAMRLVAAFQCWDPVRRLRYQAAEKCPLRVKIVIPAAPPRRRGRAGIQKPLNWLDSRFRGNDDTGVSISFCQLSTSFSAACYWADNALT